MQVGIGRPPLSSLHQDSVDLMQAVMSSDTMRMKYLLKYRKLWLMDMACYTLVPNMGREIRVRSLVKDFGYDADDLNDDKETLAIIAALTDEFKTLSELQTSGSKFQQCSYAAKSYNTLQTKARIY
jgi:hypothetical protein